MRFLYSLRPLTLGLLREVARTEEPARLALWAFWVPPRPRFLRRWCIPLVLHDFGVALGDALLDDDAPGGVAAAAAEAQSDKDAWRALRNDAAYLALDLAHFFRWSLTETDKLPLRDACLYARDGAWREAVGVARQSGERMPARPAPYATPPKLTNPQANATMRAHLETTARAKEANDGG